MKPLILLALGASALLVSGAATLGEIAITVERNDTEHATAAFKFKNIPSPSASDAATSARFALVDGDRDENGGELEKLHDGKLPTEEDQPAENFFFAAGTDGGRLLLDLGNAIGLKQVNTYSWHPNTRGPQVYKLYASDGKADGFSGQPKKGTDPEKCGWKLLAKVDTRPKDGEAGGQYGVSISNAEGSLGTYRYLLFDIAQTEDTDAFGNTFYSEVDVLASDGASGEPVKVTVEHNDNEHATAAFKFKTVPAPSASDAATKATFTMVDGDRDESGGELDKLHDGKLPTEEDQPAENFFFNAGTDGGRLLVDLSSAVSIRQVNTYSWHPNTRGPQVYRLYASEGKADGFSAQPKKEADPEKCGWKLIANVDTRPKDGEGGGQYGVSIASPEGSLGRYRYLLFDISRTEDSDAFGNTFYSEIDVVGQDRRGASEASISPSAFVIHSPDGYCKISIDTSGAPDLREWAETKLGPVLAEWYPKIMAMLPSEGYAAPTNFSVIVRPGDGVAATGGTRVTVNSDWLKSGRDGLNREAVGALLHEEVHVVQQYGWGRRSNPDAPRVRTPGFLTEGIPDYIRWFKFEPQSHGADLVWMKSRRNLSLRYDAGYRVSANFLNYVVENYDAGLVAKLNAACRQHTYTEELWKTATGKPLADLAVEWKTKTEQQLAAERPSAGQETTATQSVATAEASANTLSEAEKAAGWKLLFNGQDLTGWHNFKSEGVRPGWQVKEGALVCADPHNAGDIVTADQFDWFELQLDYNISEAGNSGIMFHVTDEGRAAWATGPEFQLEDNVKAADRIRCGWLYALYQPPIDPKTDKPLDATKPVGEWNHVRLLISPEKCEHEINGVKYFEYVLGSEDFNSRVAKSKFAAMPLFAKSKTGYIALQGDHGQVSFRNVKVRPIKTPSN